MTVARISYLTDIWFGESALDRVPEILGQLGVSKPLVVTDPHLRSLGFLNRLPISPFVVFDQVETNPEEEKAWEALDLYKKNGCDGFIALGGGSSIDLAKITALLVHHGPPLSRYAAVAGGWDLIEPLLPPLVAIPTTAGSGSEVGRAALITLKSGEKLGFLSPHLIPRAAVCDPELTVSMPASLTAATGMDAISHCIEAYCSTRENPVADAMALEGFRKAYSFLSKACTNGNDAEARRQMLLAALLGGLTFQKGLGAVHSLSHPLGGLAG
ncbi:MAG TPA: iron-containing alcohol dehydrogenase, partial [Acidobacteriota bacterium]|nr:iron-containing alcohol dehydrogenase [Acidobacteriota bacterium]